MFASNHTCPCGIAKGYRDCCGQYHDARALPPTPEALMRSRYTAFTLVHMTYLVATMKAPSSDNFDVKSAREWALNNTWLGLEILQSSAVVNNIGTVEFKAHYRANNQTTFLHEISTFRRDDGRWFYIDGNGPRMRANLSPIAASIVNK